MESSSRKATADILPQEIIHKILSFLNFKEASKLGIVSKKWLQASFTHPNLEFRLRSSREVIKWDKILERYRDEKIPIETFVFTNWSRGVYSWIDKWLDIAIQNGVKDLTCENFYSSRYPFPIFKLAKSVRELVLKHCDLMQHSCSLSTSHVADNWDSLTSLCLSYVALDDNMLQTFFTSCPSIVKLIIERCTGLEKIEVRGLEKIQSLTIEINKGDRVKVLIKASTLEHLYYYSGFSNLEELDIECQNLKSLEITCKEICGREEFIEQLISGSQFLESLILRCRVEGSLNICRSQSLKVLKLNKCNIIGEIDAPNLVLLEYEGRRILPLKFRNESIQLEHLHINFCTLDAMWFCEFKKFLSNLTSWPHVSLHISNCNEINREDLQLHHRVVTPLVDVLDVDMQLYLKYPTFVDALLWSCHPKRLNLTSNFNMINCFIDRLMDMKNLSHSTSHKNEPWLSQLKDVKVYNFWNSKPVKLRDEELAWTFTGWPKVYFLLDWYGELMSCLLGVVSAL